MGGVASRTSIQWYIKNKGNKGVGGHLCKCCFFFFSFFQTFDFSHTILKNGIVVIALVSSPLVFPPQGVNKELKRLNLFFFFLFFFLPKPSRSSAPVSLHFAFSMTSLPCVTGRRFSGSDSPCRVLWRRNPRPRWRTQWSGRGQGQGKNRHQRECEDVCLHLSLTW